VHPSVKVDCNNCWANVGQNSTGVFVAHCCYNGFYCVCVCVCVRARVCACMSVCIYLNMQCRYKDAIYSVFCMCCTCSIVVFTDAFLAILYTSAWARNTLWALPCLSVSHIFNETVTTVTLDHRTLLSDGWFVSVLFLMTLFGSLLCRCYQHSG
jgi:hypothetical protein